MQTLEQLIADYRAAEAFDNKVRACKAAGEDTGGTGADRDAFEWKKNATEALALYALNTHEGVFEEDIPSLAVKRDSSFHLAETRIHRYGQNPEIDIYQLGTWKIPAASGKTRRIFANPALAAPYGPQKHDCEKDGHIPIRMPNTNKRTFCEACREELRPHHKAAPLPDDVQAVMDEFPLPALREVQAPEKDSERVRRAVSHREGFNEGVLACLVTVIPACREIVRLRAEVTHQRHMAAMRGMGFDPTYFNDVISGIYADPSPETLGGRDVVKQRYDDYMKDLTTKIQEGLNKPYPEMAAGMAQGGLLNGDPLAETIAGGPGHQTVYQIINRMALDDEDEKYHEREHFVAEHFYQLGAENVDDDASVFACTLRMLINLLKQRQCPEFADPKWDPAPVTADQIVDGPTGPLVKVGVVENNYLGYSVFSRDPRSPELVSGVPIYAAVPESGPEPS